VEGTLMLVAPLAGGAGGEAALTAVVVAELDDAPVDAAVEGAVLGATDDGAAAVVAEDATAVVAGGTVVAETAASSPPLEQALTPTSRPTVSTSAPRRAERGAKCM
jgi:hypothetical protein